MIETFDDITFDDINLLLWKILYQGCVIGHPTKSDWRWEIVMQNDSDVLKKVKELCARSIDTLERCRPPADYREGMRFAYKEIFDIIDDAEEVGRE